MRVTRATSETLELFFALEPVPASRPRVAKFGTYYAGKYKEFLKEAPKFIPKGLEPRSGAQQVVIRIVCTKPKTGKLAFPKGDVDNYAKGILDVMTKAGVWQDDTQVIRLDVSKRYARPGEAPGCTVRVSKGDLE